MDHSQVIAALGGHNEVASVLSCRPNRVIHWKSRGIPPALWDRIIGIAKSKDIVITSADLRRTYPGRLPE